jgi:hypothetical protein
VKIVLPAILAVVLCVASFAACTYDVHIDHAAEKLDLQLVYSPCGESDAGNDAEVGP